MTRPPLVASLALALSTAALAQTTPAFISPHQAQSALGNSNNNIPFSWTPTAYQQVHSLSSFSQAPVGLFNQMRLRMASGFTGYAGKTIDIELYVAMCPNDAANASNVFANNIVSSTETNVFPRAMVNLPTVSSNAWAVAPFPFTSPFIWLPGHLSWRAIVWSNSAGSQIFTYPLDAWSGAQGGSTAPIGVGCAHTSSTQTAALSGTIPAPGGSCTFDTSSGYAAAVPMVLTLGASTTSWLSLPLPLSLAPFNAPGCTVYTDVLTTISSTTSAAGQVQIPLALPNNPLLSGQVFYSQSVFLAASANGLGLWLSNSLTNQIGGPLGVTRIYATGNPNATSGTVGVNYGMAIGFN